MRSRRSRSGLSQCSLRSAGFSVLVAFGFTAAAAIATAGPASAGIDDGLTAHDPVEDYTDEVCNDGDIPKRLAKLLTKRLGAVSELLEEAEAAPTPNQQQRLRRRAVSRLKIVEKKAQTLARTNKLPETCKDDILAAIAAVRREIRSILTEVAYDWSLLEGFTFRYAGAAIQDRGRRYLFYCSNVDRRDRHPITDHIVMRKAVRRASSGVWEYGEERVALWPGEETESGELPWDWRHTCDPEVLAGTFWYQRPGEDEKEKFTYALFYLGIRQDGDYLDGIPDGHVNQIGWAVAKDLEGPWHKVGTEPLITSDAAGYWGVGQPSATSIDRKGEVLLFYTRGEADGTRTYRQHVSLLDANHPILHGELELTTNGLQQSDGSPDSLNHGGAFVFDRKSDRFYIIRSGHPFPSTCPDFIADHLQVASIPADDVWSGGGEWTIVANLRHDVMPRLFDAGWVRRKFGGLVNPHTLEALVSVSEADDPCTLLWLHTYRIQGAMIPK